MANVCNACPTALPRPCFGETGKAGVQDDARYNGFRFTDKAVAIIHNHTAASPASAPGPMFMCVTFQLHFHHLDRLELDLRGHAHVRGAAFSCPRFKSADMVLI